MTQAMHQILVIEDEPGIRAVLRVLLEAEKYRVIEAGNAERGEIEARSHKPDLVLIDLGLPDEDGVAVIRRLREWSPCRSSSCRRERWNPRKWLRSMRVRTTMSRSPSCPELLARVRAGLRRSIRGAQALPELTLAGIRVDLTRRTASGTTGAVHLTPLEFRVLECLARQAGMIVTSRQLLREAWAPTGRGTPAHCECASRASRQARA